MSGACSLTWLRGCMNSLSRRREMVSVVARMESNGIREIRGTAFPDYTAFHPGYVFHHISFNRTPHLHPSPVYWRRELS